MVNWETWPTYGGSAQKLWNTGKKILGCIEEITKVKIKLDPWVVLFHGGEEGIKKYRKSLEPHLLNAAKRLIPRKWQEVDCPSMWEWIDSVEETYRMEELREGLEGNNIAQVKKWDNWRTFKKSWSYAEKLREAS